MLVFNGYILEVIVGIIVLLPEDGLGGIFHSLTALPFLH